MHFITINDLKFDSETNSKIETLTINAFYEFSKISRISSNLINLKKLTLMFRTGFRRVPYNGDKRVFSHEYLREIFINLINLEELTIVSLCAISNEVDCNTDVTIANLKKLKYLKLERIKYSELIDLDALSQIESLYRIELRSCDIRVSIISIKINILYYRLIILFSQ